MGAWVDLTLMFLTFLFSMIDNVEVGVVVSLVISLLLVVHRSSKARMNILVSFMPRSCVRRWLTLGDRGVYPARTAGNLSMRIRRLKRACLGP